MKYLILNPVIARFQPSEGGNKYPTHPTQFSRRAPAEAATSNPLTQYSARAPAQAEGSLNPLTYVRNISAVSLMRFRSVLSSKQELSK